MIGSLAPRAILHDEAMGYGGLAGDEPAKRLDASDAGGTEASDRLAAETGSDPDLELPALHEAHRAVDAMTGEAMPAALVACEEGA